MAIYEYEILNADGSVRGIFEAEQRMTDPVLTCHPETGETLRRILSRTFAHASSAETKRACKNVSCGFSDGSGQCGAGGSCNWD
jgi:hypothetical protein